MGTDPLELTPDHLRAAQACGSVLLPATGAHAQRLSMQRRVFLLDGKPFVATRDGGAFIETHATLLLLIARPLFIQKALREPPTSRDGRPRTPLGGPVRHPRGRGWLGCLP